MQVWSLDQEDHWGRIWQPTPVFLPGESHGQRSLWATVRGVIQSWNWGSWGNLPLIPSRPDKISIGIKVLKLLITLEKRICKAKKVWAQICPSHHSFTQQTRTESVYRVPDPALGTEHRGGGVDIKPRTLPSVNWHASGCKSVLRCITHQCQ